MLILTRKPGQVLKIDLMENVDLKTPVGELFAQGSIEVMVTAVNGAQVKLGIRADPRFLILRKEISAREPETMYRGKRAATT